MKYKRKKEMKKKIADQKSYDAIMSTVGEDEADINDKGELNDDSLLFRWFNSQLKTAG